MSATGNWDEAQFPVAEQFDIHRANAKDHLAFGAGIHDCLGAPPARLEARTAFEMLLSRLHNIRLAPGKNDFTHTPSFTLHGLKEFLLEFDR